METPDKPELKRVTLDVPDEHLAELLTVLGPFVVQHGIDAEVGDPADAAGIPAGPDVVNYDPSMVTTYFDSETGKYFAVAMKDDLIRFAENNGMKKAAGSRLITGAYLAGHEGYPHLLDAVHCLEEKKISSRHYMRSMPVEGERPVGLRVDRLNQLLSDLRNPDLDIPSIGGASLDLLTKFTEQLFNNDQPTADSSHLDYLLDD